MGFQTISIRIGAGHQVDLLESNLVLGPDGARARFAAIGASEEFFDLAIRRREGSVPDDDGHAPKLGVVRGDELELGWMSAGGEASMLSAYGGHLVLVRAQALGYVDDVPGILRSGRFAEVRGRLAERHERGLMLQPIAAKDRREIPVAELTAGEHALWEALATRCMCPACVHRSWTAEAADALAEEIARDARSAVLKLDRCMVRTPKLIRAAMLAGIHPTAGGKKRRRPWGARTVAEAATIAQELRSAKRAEVRVAAYHALFEYALQGGAISTDALASVLASEPKRTLEVLHLATHSTTTTLDAIAEPVLRALEVVAYAPFAERAISFVVVKGVPFDGQQRARLRAAVGRWRSDPGVAKLLSVFRDQPRFIHAMRE